LSTTINVLSESGETSKHLTVKDMKHGDVFIMLPQTPARNDLDSQLFVCFQTGMWGGPSSVTYVKFCGPSDKRWNRWQIDDTSRKVELVSEMTLIINKTQLYK
jgi:hypothetical protein